MTTCAAPQPGSSMAGMQAVVPFGLGRVELVALGPPVSCGPRLLMPPTNAEEALAVIDWSNGHTPPTLTQLTFTELPSAQQVFSHETFNRTISTSAWAGSHAASNPPPPAPAPVSTAFGAATATTHYTSQHSTTGGSRKRRASFTPLSPSITPLLGPSDDRTGPAPKRGPYGHPTTDRNDTAGASAGHGADVRAKSGAGAGAGAERSQLSLMDQLALAAEAVKSADFPVDTRPATGQELTSNWQPSPTIHQTAGPVDVSTGVSEKVIDIGDVAKLGESFQYTAAYRPAPAFPLTDRSADRCRGGRGDPPPGGVRLARHAR